MSLHTYMYASQENYGKRLTNVTIIYLFARRGDSSKFAFMGQCAYFWQDIRTIIQPLIPSESLYCIHVCLMARGVSPSMHVPGFPIVQTRRPVLLVCIPIIVLETPELMLSIAFPRDLAVD